MNARQLKTENFWIESLADSRETVLSLSGFFDETVLLEDLEVVQTNAVIFDLGGLKLISPSGVRTWTHWIRGLERRDPRPVFIFRRCGKAFVDHMNIVLGFLPLGAMIESFYVPYKCQACGHHENVLYESGIDFRQGTADTADVVQGPESTPCTKCGDSLLPDISSVRYFSFLKYRP